MAEMVGNVPVERNRNAINCAGIPRFHAGTDSFTISAGDAFLDSHNRVRAFRSNGHAYVLVPYIKKTSPDAFMDLFDFLTSLRRAQLTFDLERVKPLSSSTAFWVGALLAGLALKKATSAALVRISDDMRPIADPAGEIVSRLANERVIRSCASHFFDLDEIEWAYVDVLSDQYVYDGYISVR